MKDPADSYRSDRISPRKRFDEVEATIAHLFRRPHPALGGRTYGAALYDALRSRRLFREHVLEIGGGAGFVARAMHDAAIAEGRAARWTFLELSPRLLEIQREQLSDARLIQAHAERLPLREGAFDGLVLANEVIADLRTEPSASDEARMLIERYRLSATARVNVGAMRLLEELARITREGAAVCLIEFGGDFGAEPVRLEGQHGEGRHVEHSIHFGQLEQVAAALGFSVERVPLCELLGIDRTVRVASYPDVLRLRRFVPSLPVLAHVKSDLERAHPLLTRIFDFEFPQIGSPRFPDPRSRGGFCQLFQALLLRRRATGQPAR